MGQKHAIVLAAIALAITTGACSAGLPKPDSQEYRHLVAAFYVGLSGLQTGEDVRALQRLTQATELAPGEPAGWANLGLLRGASSGFGEGLRARRESPIACPRQQPDRSPPWPHRKPPRQTAQSYRAPQAELQNWNPQTCAHSILSHRKQNDRVARRPTLKHSNGSKRFSRRSLKTWRCFWKSPDWQPSAAMARR